MRKHILMAGFAAISLIPASAFAQTREQSRDQAETRSSCDRQRDNRVIATVAGAGVGGVLGNVVAGSGDKLLGTVIGAAGGAVIGNQLAKPSNDCARAYGYYDENNRWHATGVSADRAQGYYDRDGNWMTGAPNGHYDGANRWISNNGPTRGEGYYTDQRGWVPASANGYYDRNDQWVAGSDTGQYDGNGRWIAGSGGQPVRRADAYGYYDTQGLWHAAAPQQDRATGYYDRNNTWVSGTPNGHYDERGNWVPHRDDGTASGNYDSQNRWIPASSNGYYGSDGQWVGGTASGYYDQNGRWVAGVAIGHYDERGRWIAGASNGRRDANGVWIADPQPGYYDSNGRWNVGVSYGYYDNRGRWIPTRDQNYGNDQYGPGRSILSQLSQLDQYVRNAEMQRAIRRTDAYSARREINSIRTRERQMRHDRRGNLSMRDQAQLQVRIDRLARRLRMNVQ